MARAWSDPRVCLGRELTKLHESSSAARPPRSRRSREAARYQGQIAVAAARRRMRPAAAYPGLGAEADEGADAGEPADGEPDRDLALDDEAGTGE